MVYDLVNALNSSDGIENDLRSFKSYLEESRADTESEDGLRDAISGVQYTYDTDLLVYTENVDGSILRSDSRELMQDLLLEYFGLDMSSMLGLKRGIRHDGQHECPIFPVTCRKFHGSVAGNAPGRQREAGQPLAGKPV